MKTLYAPVVMFALALAACAEPADETEIDAIETPEAEVAPGAPDLLGDANGSGNVPTLAEVRLAVAQCSAGRDVLSSECSASEDGESFTCKYALDGDVPDTEREAIIAKEGETYTLVEIPSDCTVQ